MQSPDHVQPPSETEGVVVGFPALLAEGVLSHAWVATAVGSVSSQGPAASRKTDNPVWVGSLATGPLRVLQRHPARKVSAFLAES